MGQYYKPVILGSDKKSVKAFAYSHDFGNGLKLMEHSWIGNDFVGAFESLLVESPQPVVWAGDYAPAKRGEKENTYSKCNENVKLIPSELKQSNARFVINHSKKQFIDKNKIVGVKYDWGGPNEWRIHPLPLLTCEGNGQGGGDFFGKDSKKIIGSWARDIISVSNKKPKDFKEITFDLVEND